MITLQTIFGTDSISSSRLTINANYQTIASWANEINANSGITAIREDTLLTLKNIKLTESLITNSITTKSIEFPASSQKGLVIPSIEKITEPVRGSIALDENNNLRVFIDNQWQ